MNRCSHLRAAGGSPVQRGEQRGSRDEAELHPRPSFQNKGTGVQISTSETLRLSRSAAGDGSFHLETNISTN